MPSPFPNPLPAETMTTTSARSHEKGKVEVPRDTTREIFETIVFVVVLVLMLKLFVAEAFVIPTGSMASTLWGDQVICTCRECSHMFPINASDGGMRSPVSSYICENCGRAFDDPDVRNDISSVSSGDRVLVSKYAYHLHDPRRFDVPVFKYPVEPYSAKEMQGMNYIKRLVGLGGETLAVYNGDLYSNRTLDYSHIPGDQRPPRELDAWEFRYMYPGDEKARQAFREGKFVPIRKNPGEILATRRIVFDLDKQPKTPQGIRKVRWHKDPEDGAGWSMETAGFKHEGGDAGWMRYQHIDPWNDVPVTPYYIVDFLGYNVRDTNTRPFMHDWPSHWVSDLIVDATADLSSPESEVILELAKGHDRFQAIFGKGQCRLMRITTDEMGLDSWVELGSHPTKITKGGKYGLRFANVDSRLTVWIDGKPLAFSTEQSDYLPPEPKKAFAPFEKNDLLQPARIGARGDAVISKVSLWRDLHYTCAWDSRPDPKKIKKLEPELKHIPFCEDVQTLYVQPGHFLMFGDNSRSSSDSRSWGQVPQRLMLGRAIVVYWPLSRLGVIE